MQFMLDRKNFHSWHGTQTAWYNGRYGEDSYLHWKGKILIAKHCTAISATAELLCKMQIKKPRIVSDTKESGNVSAMFLNIKSVNIVWFYAFNVHRNIDCVNTCGVSYWWGLRSLRMNKFRRRASLLFFL